MYSEVLMALLINKYGKKYTKQFLSTLFFPNISLVYNYTVLESGNSMKLFKCSTGPQA